MNLPGFWTFRLLAPLIALVVLAAAGCLGALLLRLLRVRRGEGLARLVLAVALGVGALSIIVLVLGVFGLLQAPLWWVLLITCMVAGWRDVSPLVGAVARRVVVRCRRPTFGTVLWVIIGVFFIGNALTAFVPPADYDSLEYHLGVPAQFDRAGRIEPITDNAYAAFPENAESLYLLGMRLSRSRRVGASAGLILNGVFCLLTALALRQIGLRLFSREAGNLAAVLLYLWPGVTVYGGSPYVTAALMFFCTTALLALVRAVHARGRNVTGEAILCGLLTGLAIGVKYPAALFLLVPVGALLSARVVFLKDRKRAFKVLALWFIAAMVAWGPWLLRNLAWYGNPTFPLLYDVFGAKGWTAAQNAKWVQAHAPGEMSLSGFFASVRHFLFGWDLLSLEMIVFIPFVCFAGRKRLRAVGLLVVYAVFFLATWFAFTHRIERFLAPLVPILALLGGCGLAVAFSRVPRRTWRMAAASVLVVVLIVAPARLKSYGRFVLGADFAMGAVTEAEYFGESPEYRAVAFINTELPKDAKVLFIGEARTFYMEREFAAPTVFDTQPIAEAVAQARTPEDVLTYLRDRGFTHVLVNMFELLRLQDPTKAYGHTFEGEQRLGILDGFDWTLFGQFAELHMRPLAFFGGTRNVPWTTYAWPEWEKYSTPWRDLGNRARANQAASAKLEADFRAMAASPNTREEDRIALVHRAEALKVEYAKIQAREKELRMAGPPPQAFVGVFELAETVKAAELAALTRETTQATSR